MRYAVWMLAGALTLPTFAARAAGERVDGLASAPETTGPWARWQGRLSLGTDTGRLRLGTDPDVRSRAYSAALMGDYYFAPSLGGPQLLGGFRATSGVVFGSRAWLGSGSAGLTGGSLSISRHPLGPVATPGVPDAALDGNGTQPYLGLGYTGLAAHSGFSFSADLGLLARGNSGASGRSLASQNLDDAVRQLRMTPLLQLGASYAF